MVKYKAVIFDFDYTLGDATPGIVASANYALVKLGYKTASAEAVKKTVGHSLEDSFMLLSGSNSEEEAAGYVKYYLEKGNEVMLDGTTLYSGALQILSLLKKDGVKIGIVSTKYRRRINDILQNSAVPSFLTLLSAEMKSLP